MEASDGLLEAQLLVAQATLDAGRAEDALNLVDRVSSSALTDLELDLDHLAVLHTVRGHGARDSGRRDIALSSFAQLELVANQLDSSRLRAVAALGTFSTIVTWGPSRLVAGVLPRIKAYVSDVHDPALEAEMWFFVSRVHENQGNLADARRIALTRVLPLSWDSEPKDLQIARLLLCSRLYITRPSRDVARSEHFLHRARDLLMPGASLLRQAQYQLGVSLFLVTVGDTDNAERALARSEALLGLGGLKNRQVALLHRILVDPAGLRRER